MDFELSQDHKVLQSSVRDFVEKEIKPLAIQIDENHKIPDELVQKMSAMGFLGSYVPEAYGGAGLDILSYAIVVEEVSKACASSGVLISAHTSLACDPILQFGTEDQKKKYPPPSGYWREDRLLPAYRTGSRQRRGWIGLHLPERGRWLCH